MSWTLDTSTQGTYGANDPSTLTHTCSANTRLLVLVIFVNGNTARTGGAPTYNTTETFSDSGQGFVVETECGVEVWYLLDPTTGSALTVSVPNTGAENVDLSVMSFEPSTGNAAFDAANSTVGTTQNPSLTLTTSETNCLVIGALGSGDRDIPTAGTNYNLVHTYDAGNQTWGSEYDLDSGGSTSVTVDFGTARNDDWGLIGVSFTDAGSVTHQESYSGSILNTGALAGQANKLLENDLQASSGALLSMTMNYPTGSIYPVGFHDFVRSITREFVGSILATGEELSTIAKQLAGSILGTGSILSSIATTLSGSINGTANLFKNTYKSFTGSVLPFGFHDFVKSITREFVGSILATGSELNTVAKQLSGSIANTGSILKTTYKTLTGSVLGAGATIRKTYTSLAGSVDFTGVLDTLKSAVIEFTGSLDFSSNLYKVTQKGISGSTNFSSELYKKIANSLSGSIDFAQDLYKIISKTMSSSVLATGLAEVRSIIVRVWSGSISATGEIYKTINKTYAGSVDFASERLTQVNKLLTGVVQATGALINQTSGVITVLATGAITATGEVIKRTSTTMSGALDWAGNVFKTTLNTQQGYLDFQSALDKLYTKVLSVAGSLDFSSDINNRIGKLIVSGVEATGQTIRNTAHAVSGQLSLSGNAIRKSIKSFIGSLSPTGAVSTSIFKIINITGSLLNTGDLSRIINKNISSGIDFYGATTKRIDNIVSGSISATATLYRKTLKTINSAISATGSLLASLVGTGALVANTFKGMFKNIFKGMR